MDELDEKQIEKLQRIADFADKSDIAEMLPVVEELQKLNETTESKMARDENSHQELLLSIEKLGELLSKEIPAPIVNVDAPVIPEPVINVEAPKVSVQAPQPVVVPAPEVKVETKEVVFPDIQKVKVENPQKEVVLLDEEGKPIDLKKLGEYIGKSIKVGGGGGLSGLSTYGAALDTSLTDQLKNYLISAGPITDTGYLYIGYIRKDGAWYIKRQHATTKVWGYVKGSSDFDTSWGGKTGLSYSNFNDVF
jgi:hypothetical protein